MATCSDYTLAALEALAAEMEAFGCQEAPAVRETLRRATEALIAWWNAPLSMAEVGAWGGYSESQLRRLIREGKIPLAPDGGIRRLHVPVHPGHRLPLGLEPAPVAAASAGPRN